MDFFRAFHLRPSQIMLPLFLQVPLNIFPADNIFTGICPGGQRCEQRGVCRSQGDVCILRPAGQTYPGGPVL